MGVSNGTGPVGTTGMTWSSPRRERAAERAARHLQRAQRDAEAAAAHYRALREAAAAPAHGEAGTWRPMPTWQQLLLLVVGGGLLCGLLAIWFLAAAYVGPLSLLILPATAGLVWGVVVWRRRHRPVRPRRRRPVVADLVRAAQQMHEAEAALQRLRDEQGGGAARPGQPPPPWRRRGAPHAQ